MKHKFRNIPKEYKGIRYQSTLEANYAAHLDLLISSGEVLFYLRQPKFHMPSGNTYAADFLIFYSSGDAEFVDTKGKVTDLFLNKMRELEASYPVKIKVISRGDF